MKKTILMILLSVAGTCIPTRGQDPENGFRTGIYVNAGWNLPVRLTTKYITGETSPWHGYESFSGGIKVSMKLSENYRLAIAACWSEHTIGFELSPPIYAGKKIYTETFRLVSIPLTLTRYLTNNYFVDAGTMVDLPLNGRPEWVDAQAGFGLTLGAGKDISIGRFILELAPELELHSVIPFEEERYHQRLFVAAMRLGVSYGFRPAAARKENEEKSEEADR